MFLSSTIFPYVACVVFCALSGEGMGVANEVMYAQPEASILLDPANVPTPGDGSEDAWAEEMLPEKVASVQIPLWFSGSVSEGEAFSSQVNVPYACSLGRISIPMSNPGGTTGRSSLRWIVSVNGFAVMDGASGSYTLPKGVLQQGDNTVQFEFVVDADGVAEVTQVAATGYFRSEEQNLSAGSFKERGQGPRVVNEGDSLTFTVSSSFVCSGLAMLVHTVDRGGVGNGMANFPYVVYVDGAPIENGTATLTFPSGYLQQGSHQVAITFPNDGDAKAESALVCEDSYIQVKEVALPDGSFRSRGQGPVVINEGDSLTFTVNSPYAGAEAKISIHSTDRGRMLNGISPMKYVLIVNGQPVIGGTSSAVTLPSGILHQGDNTLVISFQNDGDATAETTLVLEDSYIQVKEKVLGPGSFHERGQDPVVVHEGDSLTFNIASEFACTQGSVKLHMTDQGGADNGRSYLKYILEINGFAVLSGTTGTYNIPAGVIQKGSNAFVFEFPVDTDTTTESTLVLEDSFISLEAGTLMEGAFKDRGRGPGIINELDVLTFSLDLDAGSLAGELWIHAADRGGVDNGTTTLKYDLQINGANVLTNKSLGTKYAIPAGQTVAGANTFAIKILKDTDTKAETALLLEDSYIYVQGENWPDADSDGLPDYLEGDPTLDTDGDGDFNYLDPDSDNDGFRDGDEYRSGYDPLDPESIPANLLILDETVSPSFWRDDTLELLVAPVSFVTPDEDGNPPILPAFAMGTITVSPPTYSADVSIVKVDEAPKPLAVVMLFDGSGSLVANDKNGLRIQAGKAFIDQLRPSDQAAVLEFARYLSTDPLYVTGIHQDFTSSAAALNTAMDKLDETGGTPLYESALETLEWFDASRDDTTWQRVLILFSDGEPNTSTHRDEVIAFAQEAKIPVVTVGLADAAIENTVAAEAMRTLAEETHGLYVPAKGAADLANIYTSLAEGLLGEAYQMTFVFSPHPPGGTEITVSLESNYGDAAYTFIAPGIPDSDGDGLYDNEEDANANGLADPGETDPNNADSDGDGVNDYDEIHLYGTDPTEPDSDDDGSDDGTETDFGSDPNDDDDLPPNLTSMTIGILTVEAEQFVQVQTNVYETRGYARINSLLYFSGTLTLDKTALTVSANGTWTLDNVPYVGDVSFYNGSITVNASTGVCAGLNRAASLLEVIELGIEFEGFSFVAGGIQIAGAIELPEEIGIKAEFENLTVSRTTGIDFVGSITLPDVEFADFPWGFKDSHLDFNTIENEFGGGGKISTPKFDVLIEQITIRNGRLETVLLGIGFPEPGINLDSSGVVWLKSVSGGLMDMAPGPPPLKIKAACELTIGPAIAGFQLITGVPEVLLDTSGMFTATGTIYLFGGPDEGYEMSQIVASFGTPSSAEPGFRFSATAYLWKEVFEPQMTFSIDFDNKFEGTATGTFDLGNVDLAILGDTIGDLVEIALDAVDTPTFDLAATVNNDGFTGSFSADIIAGDIDFTVKLEPGGLPSLDASFDPAIDIDIDWPWKMTPEAYAEYTKQGPQKAVAGSFVIPANLGKVLVTLKYTDGSTDFELVNPNGVYFTPSGADGIAYGYASNTDRRFAFYMLNNPVPGTWQVEVPDPESLGMPTLEVLPLNSVPGAEMVSAKNLAAPANTIRLGYIARDPGEQAAVSLHYDTDNQGADGLTIVSELVEEDGYAEYAWDTSDTPPGTYYVYVKVDDGKSGAEVDYLEDPVTILHETSVAAPTGLETTVSGSSVTLEWEPAKAANLQSYRVYWLEQDKAGAKIQSDAVGSLQNYALTLTPGRSYRVWVTAVDDQGAESAPSVAKQIRPLVSSSDNNPPQITSDPLRGAMVGTPYSYNVDANDADADTLTYALTIKPAGMTINAASGVISWTPTEQQRGVYNVAVSVTDPHAGADTQAFTVTVSAPPAKDSDGDGLNDETEISYRTDSLSSDTDGDGLSDGEEVNTYHTDPTKVDTDGDGASDSEELAAGTDPLTTRSLSNGSVLVTLSPSAALETGAQWRIDSGPWRYSGEQVDELSVGMHAITYAPVEGYDTPAATSVNITKDVVAEVNTEYQEKGPQPVSVPNVAGQAQVNAQSAITAAGLTVGTVTEAYSATVAAGVVISQNPAAGTEVLPGSAVSLVVSKGEEDPGPSGCSGGTLKNTSPPGKTSDLLVLLLTVGLLAAKTRRRKPVLS